MFPPSPFTHEETLPTKLPELRGIGAVRHLKDKNTVTQKLKITIGEKLKANNQTTEIEPFSINLYTMSNFKGFIVS